MIVKNKESVSNLVQTTISSKQNASQAAIWLTFFAMVQKALSVLQQILIGRAYGATADTDAFFIAQIIPLLLGGMIAIALTTSLIPLLTHREVLEPGVLSGLFLVILLLLVLSNGAVLFFSNEIIHILGHGFEESTAVTAIRLLKPMSLLLIAMGVGGILTASFYASSRFILPAAAASLLYIGGIGGILLKPWFGVDGMVWGLVLGATLQAMLLGVLVDRAWFQFPRFDLNIVLNLFKSFVPVLLGMSVSTFYLIIDRSYATAFPTGYVASFNFAGNLMTIPLQMIVTNVNSALLPSLVLLKTNYDKFATLLIKAATWMGFLLLPTVIIVLTWSQPLVRLVFHSESFGLEAISFTSGILVAYGFAIIGLATKDISTTALIALGRERLPMLVGFGCLLLSISLKIFLIPRLGYLAIAYSTDIASTLNGLILLIALSSLLPLKWLQALRVSGWKVLTAGLAMIAFWFFFSNQFPIDNDLAKWSYICAVAGVYVLASTVLRLPEMGLVWKQIQPSHWRRFIGKDGD